MQKDIVALREELAGLDGHIVALLAQRFTLTRAIGDWKERLGLPPVDEARVRDFLARWGRMAQEHDTSTDFVVRVAGKIHELVAEDHLQRYPAK